MKSPLIALMILAITPIAFSQTMYIHTSSGVTALDISTIDSITFSSLGPLAWWPLGEGSGTAVYDSSGHGYNGVLYNATWVSGGVQLTTNTQSVIFDDLPFRLNEGTWDVTVNVSTYNNGWSGGGAIVNKDTTGYQNDGRLLITTDGKIQWTIDDSTSKSEKTIVSPDSIHTNVDYQITAEWGSSGMKLYIDGVLVGSNSYTGAIRSRGSHLTIGSHYSGQRSFLGIVKDLKVYATNIY